jgi:hypothetical protein
VINEYEIFIFPVNQILMPQNEIVHRDIKIYLIKMTVNKNVIFIPDINIKTKISSQKFQIYMSIYSIFFILFNILNAIFFTSLFIKLLFFYYFKTICIFSLNINLQLIYISEKMHKFSSCNVKIYTISFIDFIKCVEIYNPKIEWF